MLGLNISDNKAPEQTPQPGVSEVTSNSYADSVAGRLGAYGAKVRVNGRDTNAGYTKEQMQEIYQGYIFGAIKKTSNKVAEILTDHIEIVDADGKTVEGKRHPYQDAIDAATMDNSKFYKGIATYFIVLGEAFLDAGERTMVAGNIKPTAALELMQSNLISRTYDDDGNLKTYKYSGKMPNGLPDIKHYVPSNVIAITDLNPWDLRKGYGMIRPIVALVALENTATRLQTATLANAIKAPGVLSSKEKLEKDDYEDLKHQVNTRWTSNDMDKAGVPIVTNGGFIDYKSLLEDFDKLAMQKIRNLNRDAFFAALGASKTILGIEESGTTRDVGRLQNEQYILDACMPIANGILNGLNQDYINNYPVDYKRNPIKMRAIAPIEKDLEQEKGEADINKVKAETFKTYVDAGMDPQLASELSGLELQDNKKIVMVPKLPPAPTPPPPDNSNKPANVVIHNHKHKGPTAKELAKVAKNALTEKEQTTLTKAETKLYDEVQKLDTALGAMYVKQVNALPQDEQENYINKLAELLLAYYVVAVGIFGKRRALEVATDFGGTVIPFTVSKAIQQSLKERLAKVANEHFSTIDSELAKIIANGTRDNLGRDVIIRQIREKVSSDVATWQVERLVNTETANAFRQAKFLSDKQFIDGNGHTGKVFKVWRTNSPRPCPFCTSIAGKRIPFEDNFFNVGDVVEAETQTAEGNNKQVYYLVRFVEVNAGGLHPNCHCDYTLEFE